MKTIDTPDGPVDFPDEMSDADIEKALQRLYPPTDAAPAATPADTAGQLDAVPDMLKGMDSPVTGPGEVAPNIPATSEPQTLSDAAMNWYKGGSSDLAIQDRKATEIRNQKAQAGYEALPGYLKPVQAASDLLTVAGRLPASMLTGAAALVSPGEYKSITPEDVIARLRTGKTSGPEFDAEVAKQKQAYEDAAYRSGWAGTAAQVASLAPLGTAKLTGAVLPDLMATGAAMGGTAAAGNEQDPLMGMAAGAAGGAAGYGLGKLGTAALDTALGVAGKVLPVGPLKVPTVASPMTKDQWNALARQKYAEAESHGVVFNRAGLIHLRDQIRQELTDKGYHPDNEPGMTAMLKTLDDYINVGAATQRGMQTLREMAQGGWRFGNRRNNAFVSKAVNEIDNLATNLSPGFMSAATRNPAAAAAAAREARNAYSTGAKLQTVENLVERGRLQGDTNISKNVRQSVRKQVAKIVDPTRPLGRGWTPVQKEAVRQAVKTTTAQDIAHGLSGLMPRDKLSTAIHVGSAMPAAIGGFMAGGPLGAAVAPLAWTATRMGLGAAAEKWANSMASKSVDELVRVISTGQTSRQAAQSVLQKLAAAKRQAVMQRLAQLGIAAAVMTQPFNQGANQNAQ